MTPLELALASMVAIMVIAPVFWLIRAIVQEYGAHRVPCLLYHQLQAVGRPAGEVDPVYVCYADRFREQMDYLKAAGYTTLTLGDLMASRADPRRLPQRPVLVTFDDGFASNYELAFPVLRHNGQRATIFVTPDKNSENFRAFAALDRPLEDAQLLELSAWGIDIQSHGLSHRFLTELTDEDLRSELEAPRTILESITRRPVRYLAIPGGAYDRRVRRAARAAGYEAVFCMRKGSASVNGDPLCLPRMVVSRDMNLDDFRSLLTPAGWLRGRIVSIVQEAISDLLGMRRTDALRNFLYQSRFASVLRPQRLALLIIAVCVLTVATTALVVLRSWR